mmetsp:Transcript_5589/g.12171  ORF Transcript_5589/g.12171 Transcript_5589/m.12171 type:complete len:251 (+) Transcript_5589:550-1302(+)
MLGQDGEEAVEEIVHAYLGRRRHRDHTRAWELLTPAIEDLLLRSDLDAPRFAQRRALAQQVNLIHNDEQSAGRALNLPKDRIVDEILLEDVHSQKHSICVGERAAHAGHHALVKLVLWYHYAWRVGVDDLEVFPVYNAENAMSGSLCLGCRDCQTLANQTVHQRRLADIGYTYYGNEARAVRLRRCGRRRRRRSCASDWHRVAYDWPRQVNASAASRQKQHFQQLNPPNTREAHLAPRRRPCYRFSTVRL